MTPKTYASHVAAGLRAGRDRTCGTKTRHSSKESAASVVDAIEATNGDPTARRRLEAYPCAYCAHWHVGRRRPQDELATAGVDDATSDVAGDETSVLEDFRDLEGDPTASLAESYPVWILSAGSTRLDDARFAGEFHFQVRTASGTDAGYARAGVRNGVLELDEVGPGATAALYREAASRLPGAGVCLLLAPRGLEALWHPAIGVVVVVFPPALTGRVLGPASFEEEALARIHRRPAVGDPDSGEERDDPEGAKGP